MLDYAGSLQRIALSRTLWLLVTWPLLGFAWQVLVIRRRVLRARGGRAIVLAGASGRLGGVAFIVVEMATTLAHVAVLKDAVGGGRVLLEPGPRGARFGWLDAHVALSLDALSAAACTFACLVTLAAALFLARRPAAQRGWPHWAWLQLALEGAVVSFIADGFVAMAVGWAIAALAGAWLAGWRHPRLAVVAATRSAVAMGAMLVGASVLFWGLAGSWSADDYILESSPRFVAVRESGPSIARDNRPIDSRGAGGPGVVTLAGAPGVSVFVDEAVASYLRAPFVRAPVDPGAHVFHVRRGSEPDDEAVGPIAIASGDEVALVPVGPSLTFRAIADQLSLRNASGDQTVRRALETRLGPGGSAVVAAALAAWLLAAGTMSGAVRCGGAPPELAALACAATSAALGPYFLARVSFLFALVPYTGAAVAWVGGAMLLTSVWRALAFGGVQRWVVFAGGTPAALGCVALGVGGVVHAMWVVGAAGLVAAAAHFHAARRRVAWDDSKQPGASVDGVFLVSLPDRLGALLVRMERWVLDAVAGAAAGTVRAAAWVFAEADRHIVSAPADAAATQLVLGARGVEPILGGSIARVAWVLLAAAALAALTTALRAAG